MEFFVNKQKILAIIPARGGSKRLVKKNILKLAQKPMLAWSIEAALGSKYIENILVTSDDDEILNIASSYDVQTIKRPMELALDTSSTFDTIKHAIANTEADFDYVILLQPTSPLRDARHINEAIELLNKKSADAIISVCEMEHSPLWSNTLDKNRSMKNFLDKNIINKRSQELQKYYRLNGAIYICKKSLLLKEKTFFISDNIYAYEMDRKSSIDIDEEIDFKLAQLFLEE
jgi:CMP-N-acetylneuraminic acid synthetase